VLMKDALAQFVTKPGKYACHRPRRSICHIAHGNSSVLGDLIGIVWRLPVHRVRVWRGHRRGEVFNIKCRYSGLVS